MSEAKHTPGPWKVDTTTTFGAYGVWTDYATHPGHDGAGYGSQICSMFTVSFPQTDKATREERDANARLIAASPTLYEFARDIAENYEHEGPAAGHCYPSCRRCKAERVILKATQGA